MTETHKTPILLCGRHSPPILMPLAFAALICGTMIPMLAGHVGITSYIGSGFIGAALGAVLGANILRLALAPLAWVRGGRTAAVQCWDYYSFSYHMDSLFPNMGVELQKPTPASPESKRMDSSERVITALTILMMVGATAGAASSVVGVNFLQDYIVRNRQVDTNKPGDSVLPLASKPKESVFLFYRQSQRDARG